MKYLNAVSSNQPWRAVLGSLALLAAGGLILVLHLLTGFPGTGPTRVLVAALCLFAWVPLVRFLLLDIWGRWFWLVLMAGSLILVLTVGTAGLVLGIVFSSIFLTMRQYTPWRMVPDRLRAVGFGSGILAIAAVILMWRTWSLGDASGFVESMTRVGQWSLVSIGVFWAYSLFHLAIRMRLHFMRLRPKLAVSAFLIGFVPLLLVVGLGLMILYTGLGGARAARTETILESWRQMTADGADLAPALFDTTFVWSEASVPPRPVRPTDIPAPDWMPDLARRFRADLAGEARLARADSVFDATAVAGDSTGWFLAGGRLWLMRWRSVLEGPAQVEAWDLATKPLTHLSGMLHVGIDLGSAGDTSDDGDLNFTISTAQTDSSRLDGFAGLQVSYRDTSGDQAFWDRFLFFGGTFFEVNAMKEDGLGARNIFLNLRVGWPDLKKEFLEGEENLNVAVVVALSIVAFMFLVLEVFAIFFGVRISEGIVTGVHALRRGTRAVAEGNLDTVITIPNEDEFGDLAASFNEMTVAVKHGREIALANERLIQELATARAIQVRLLPSREPALRGFEVTGASIPSREIGGDYYDFLAQGEDQIGIAIGDVSGKGMPAALLMSNLQASLHGQVLHPGSVSGVVQRVNDLLVKSTDPHMFATFFYGLLDVPQGTFTCTNAGHNPPLLLRNDGTLEELTKGGLLLGMIGDEVYKQETVQMEPGEVIVMYTDGITEAVGPSAEEDDPEAMFGEEALYEVMRRNRNLPASGIKDAILDAVSVHTEGVPQSDDITLVVIRRLG